jgi:hypothetical protein
MNATTMLAQDLQRMLQASKFILPVGVGSVPRICIASSLSSENLQDVAHPFFREIYASYAIFPTAYDVLMAPTDARPTNRTCLGFDLVFLLYNTKAKRDKGLRAAAEVALSCAATRGSHFIVISRFFEGDGDTPFTIVLPQGFTCFMHASLEPWMLLYRSMIYEEHDRARLMSTMRAGFRCHPGLHTKGSVKVLVINDQHQDGELMCAAFRNANIPIVQSCRADQFSQTLPRTLGSYWLLVVREPWGMDNIAVLNMYAVFRNLCAYSAVVEDAPYVISLCPDLFRDHIHPNAQTFDLTTIYEHNDKAQTLWAAATQRMFAVSPLILKCADLQLDTLLWRVWQTCPSKVRVLGNPVLST